MDQRKIGCIIILYNPIMPLLRKVVESVENQVDTIYFVDNSDELTDVSYVKDALYFKMNGNEGIAAAQNIAIHYFIGEGFTHLFFQDQDSILTSGLVNQLMLDLTQLQGSGILVGAIGARPYNRESGKKYMASGSKGIKRFDHLTEVSEIMNSASLMPAENFTDVGTFDEGLFIDGVDHEWCWRAKVKNRYRFFISEKATISHFLGEGDRFFLVRSVSIPTPFRVYYQFRNYLILSKRSYVPTYWKWKNGLKFFIKFFYFSLFLKPRGLFFKNSLRGILDGIKTR